jgi:hypothetical protein
MRITRVQGTHRLSDKREALSKRGNLGTFISSVGHALRGKNSGVRPSAPAKAMVVPTGGCIGVPAAKWLPVMKRSVMCGNAVERVWTVLVMGHASRCAAMGGVQLGEHIGLTRC